MDVPTGGGSSLTDRVLVRVALFVAGSLVIYHVGRLLVSSSLRRLRDSL